MEYMKSNMERVETQAMDISLKVAVIGAGVSGLVTARELLREGHRVVVYEKSNQLGGTWVYDPRVDSDPLGLDPKREAVHCSLYASLRTNLPRHLMSLSDYPFTDRVYGDPRNFPGHEEVLEFVKDFARKFGLTGLIRFETEVVRVERVELGDNDKWVVESRTSGASREDEFQAVVVCTGHYAEPIVANLPGIEKWPGKQLHSHNYRVPDSFQNQVVVIIGSGASAIDISRELASVAKQVHLSSRSPDVKSVPNFYNTWQHSEIYHVYGDGTIEFQDGSRVRADVIIHCTGYKYSFPFLRTNGIVSIDNNRVGPLYKHVFPPHLSPRLSFVGIHYKSIIFATIELQSKWVARVLSGKAILPSEKEMLVDVEEHYMDMLDRGVPKHRTHQIHPHEFEYLDMIADLAGVSPVAEQIKKIHQHVFEFLISTGIDVKRFRDEWDPNNV